MSIIGHEKEIEHLKRLASGRRLSHGYLFFGPPRVGKHTLALHLANFLENGVFGEPKILGDAFSVAPDSERTIGIDRIREIKNFLWQRPNRSPHRTVIIGQGEFLTTEAQNALLKIAEEPPSSSLVIVTVDDPERLLPTLQSRLHKIYFSVVPLALVEKWLVEEQNLSQKEAQRLAERSMGQPGLAWAMLKNTAFKKMEKKAEQFLELRSGERRDLIKDLVVAPDFDWDQFLEILMIVMPRATGRNAVLWHRVLALRRQSDYFNLNPRLQLTALADALSS